MTKYLLLILWASVGLAVAADPVLRPHPPTSRPPDATTSSAAAPPPQPPQSFDAGNAAVPAMRIAKQTEAVAAAHAAGYIVFAAGILLFLRKPEQA